MSESFRPLYEKLVNICENINDASISAETKKGWFTELKGLAKTYIDAKSDQHVPKCFASQQRYVRLSNAQKLLDISGDAASLINSFSAVEERACGFANSDMKKKEMVSPEKSFIDAEKRLAKTNKLAEKSPAILDDYIAEKQKALKNDEPVKAK